LHPLGQLPDPAAPQLLNNPLFQQYSTFELLDMMSSPASSSSAVQWDGITTGEPYEQYRAAIQLQDLNMVTKSILVDSTKQLPAAARLRIFSTHIQAESTAIKVLERFKQLCTHYIEQAKRNRFMSNTEAERIGMLLLSEYVHAAAQVTEAERALRNRIVTDYAPIAAAAQQERLLAATTIEIHAATATLNDAREALTSVGDAPTQQPNEDAASFQTRQQQHTQQQQAAQQSVTAAQQALTDLTSIAAVTSFPTVRGEDITPSDAIIILFWIVMDVLFGLGGESRLQQFYSLGSPGSQGSDTLEVWSQRVTKEYQAVNHLTDANLSMPELTFIRGLNEPELRSFLEQWTNLNLGKEREPARRLSRTIDAALTLHQQQVGQRNWGMQFTAATGAPFVSSLSSSRGSGSSKGYSQQQQQFQQSQQSQQLQHLLVKGSRGRIVKVPTFFFW
jgi:hypothetical protein